jgi:hypothetical protein
MSWKEQVFVKKNLALLRCAVSYGNISKTVEDCG